MPKKEIIRGECYGGACDGKEFDHTADMKRVKLQCSKKHWHVYVYHADMSAVRDRPMFVHESIEAWKVA